MRRLVTVGIVLALVFVAYSSRYAIQEGGYLAKSSVRNWLNADRAQILEYQQYRIRENAQYHNYDTTYTACANDWYIGHDTTPAPGW